MCSEKSCPFGLDRKVKSSSGGERIDLLRATRKKKVLQDFPSKGAKHFL